MNHDRKGIWIPTEIWDLLKGKPILERLINHYFLKISLDSTDWKELEDIGIAQKSGWDPYQISSYLKRKKPQIFPGNDNLSSRCSWCTSKTFRVKNLYYPLSKDNGGIETVEICHNCYDEYHYIKDTAYTLKDWVQDSFKERKGDYE